VRHTQGVGILRELGAVRAPARAPRKVRAAWGSCLLWGQLVGLAAVCAPKNSSLYGPLAESVVNQTKCALHTSQAYRRACHQRCRGALEVVSMVLAREVMVWIALSTTPFCRGSYTTLVVHVIPNSLHTAWKVVLTNSLPWSEWIRLILYPVVEWMWVMNFLSSDGTATDCIFVRSGRSHLKRVKT